jgi:YD repeat-containing protein
MKKNIRKVNHKIASYKHLMALFLFCLIAPVALHSQGNIPMALRPGSPAGSSNLSGFESINPYSGNLNFSLPLMSARGRGSNAVSINLNVNQKFLSKEWLDEQDGNRPYPYMDAGNIWDKFFQNDKGFIPIKLNGVQSGAGINTSCPGGGSAYIMTNTILTFTAPDGTQYEMRDRNTNGQPHAVNCNQNGYSRGTVFETNDGSHTIFVSDSAIADNTAPGYAEQVYWLYPTGNLITKDGTVYRIEDGKAIRSRDRNGNTMTFTYSGGYDLSRITKITDSLNREITFEYGVLDIAPYGLCDKITYKGFGGDSRVIRISYKNLRDILRSGYSLQTGIQLFPNNFISGYPSGFGEWNGASNYDPVKPSSVWLPDGRYYDFKYNSYGELARVQLPTGAATEYDWGFNVGSGQLGINYDSNTNSYYNYNTYFRRVIERRSYSDGANLDNKLVLSGLEALGGRVGYVTEDLYNSSGGRINRTKHFYNGVAGSSDSFVGISNAFQDPWLNGKEYQTDLIDSNGTTLLRRSTTTWAQSSPFWWSQGSNYAPSNNPRVTETKTFLYDSNQVGKKTFGYDGYNNLTDTYEYDYGIGAPGLFLRRSHTDYLTTNPVNNLNYTSDNIHILNLPSQSWVSSDTSGNNKISLSKYEYDNYASDSTHAALVDRFNISGHDSNYGTSYTTRGQVTKVTSYADAQNQTGAVSTYTQYDIAGNTVKAIDAMNNAMTLSYNDSFGSPDAEARNSLPPSLLSGQQTFAFATSATNQLGYTGYTQVDYYTGQVVDAEDMNGNVSTTLYNDVLDRPTQTISANNRPAFRKQATFGYDDLNRKVTVTSDSKIYGDNLIKSESFYDKSGRTTETRQYEDVTNYTASQQQYDSLGRAYKSSNPFRPYLSETPQWTTTSFDALGRVIQIKTPDNAIVGRSYSGTTTTVTDQALRKRSGTTDALGRLLNVVEDPTGLNYQTNYTYDLLGRLRKTAQTEGATTQNRYFMYNDLGRLIRAKQVEQNPNSSPPAATDPITGNTNWSVSYSYDNNGNIISTTDANNRTITGTYDNLNRLTFRDYSEASMPDVTFTFDDQNIANSKGQLTAVTSTVSATRYTAFDELGRIKSSQQLTGGQTYTMPDYSYDLSGALVSQTYPSNRVVTTETDNIGRLSRVASQLPNSVQKTMLSNLAYTSFGAVKQAKLGNGKWESAQFDNQRLQIKQIGLGGSAGDTSLLKLEYGYGTATANNGSLIQQKITIPGAAN